MQAEALVDLFYELGQITQRLPGRAVIWPQLVHPEFLGALEATLDVSLAVTLAATLAADWGAHDTSVAHRERVRLQPVAGMQRSDRVTLQFRAQLRRQRADGRIAGELTARLTDLCELLRTSR